MDGAPAGRRQLSAGCSYPHGWAAEVAGEGEWAALTGREVTAARSAREMSVARSDASLLQNDRSWAAERALGSRASYAGAEELATQVSALNGTTRCSCGTATMD
jgi:hypothetical protein